MRAPPRDSDLSRDDDDGAVDGRAMSETMACGPDSGSRGHGGGTGPGPALARPWPDPGPVLAAVCRRRARSRPAAVWGIENKAVEDASTSCIVVESRMLLSLQLALILSSVYRQSLIHPPAALFHPSSSCTLSSLLQLHPLIPPPAALSHPSSSCTLSSLIQLHSLIPPPAALSHPSSSCTLSTIVQPMELFHGALSWGSLVLSVSLSSACSCSLYPILQHAVPQALAGPSPIPWPRTSTLLLPMRTWPILCRTCMLSVSAGGGR
jgi:hypothetical protein